MTAAFDAVHHSILLQRLQRSYGISGNPLAWFTSYLAARAQSVRFRHKKSHSCHVPHGVPQGSVLGPLLFILYVGNVAEIPERLGLGSHFYADDAQLYLTCRRDDSAACASCVFTCIEEIDQWVAANRLAMNPAKADVLWCSTSHQPSDSPLTLGGVTVLPSSEVRNLGVVFDSDLSLKSHVSQLTAHCYSRLRRIKSCRRALTRITAATVVNSLIVTRLDYCNSLLAGCTKHSGVKSQHHRPYIC